MHSIKMDVCCRCQFSEPRALEEDADTMVGRSHTAEENVKKPWLTW